MSCEHQIQDSPELLDQQLLAAVAQRLEALLGFLTPHFRLFLLSMLSRALEQTLFVPASKLFPIALPSSSAVAHQLQLIGCLIDVQDFQLEPLLDEERKIRLIFSREVIDG